jgi:hypothetical protein
MDKLYRELKRLVAVMPHVRIVAALTQIGLVLCCWPGDNVVLSLHSVGMVCTCRTRPLAGTTAQYTVPPCLCRLGIHPEGKLSDSA